MAQATTELPSVAEGGGIQLTDIRKSFGQLEVLKGISLNVAPREVVCIIGPSGSGKSTLLKCINLLEPPSAGTIWVNGVELTGPKSDVNAARSTVGMVFQHFNLFPHLSILQNVMVALRVVKRMPKQQAEQVALQQLTSVGVDELSDMRPADCSGGQQQRVAIARALAMDPSVMLFDEATSALDPELVKGVLTEMKRLADAGMTMVVVTHEIAFAREAADRVVFMDDGRIVEDGPARETLAAPKTERLRDFLSQVL